MIGYKLTFFNKKGVLYFYYEIAFIGAPIQGR